MRKGVKNLIKTINFFWLSFFKSLLNKFLNKARVMSTGTSTPKF